MKIKNYNQWLNESERWEGYEPNEILRELCEDIISKSFHKKSYTTCAQSNTIDPDKDFEKFMELLRAKIKEYGLNETRIMRAFKEADQDWFNCGLWDMIMYKALGPNSDVNLGGDLESQDNHENIIRFAYGWHKTGYGKLFIETNYGSESKFFDTLPASLKAEIQFNIDVTFDNGKLIITSKNDDLKDVQNDLAEFFLNTKIVDNKIIAE